MNQYQNLIIKILLNNEKLNLIDPKYKELKSLHLDTATASVVKIQVFILSKLWKKPKKIKNKKNKTSYDSCTTSTPKQDVYTGGQKNS